MKSFKLKFLGVTILQGVEFPIFLLIFEWAFQQCSATALPVISTTFGTRMQNDVPIAHDSKHVKSETGNTIPKWRLFVF